MTGRRINRRSNKHVLLRYIPARNLERKAPAHFPAHWARCEEFHAAGTLLKVGVFANTQAHGTIGIFTNGESAREFAEGDPFVREGVVARWEIHETKRRWRPTSQVRPLSMG